MWLKAASGIAVLFVTVIHGKSFLTQTMVSSCLFSTYDSNVFTASTSGCLVTFVVVVIQHGLAFMSKWFAML